MIGICLTHGQLEAENDLEIGRIKRANEENRSQKFREGSGIFAPDHWPPRLGNE
jgi:hypothetical protein